MILVTAAEFSRALILEPRETSGDIRTFDSSIKVGILYRALPSAAPALHKFGISLDTDENATLSEISKRRNVCLDDLISDLRNLSWEEDSSLS